MTVFAIYDTETCQVKRTIICKDWQIEGQCRGSEDFIVLEAEIQTHLYKVIGGKLVEQEPPEPDILAEARAQRDRLLAASDWTQVSDNRLSVEERSAWAQVRESWRLAVDQVRAGGIDVVWEEWP